jgi:hypothetical protein
VDDTADRRKKERFQVALPVKMRHEESGDDESMLEGRTVDISSEGLCVIQVDSSDLGVFERLREKLKKESRVALEITIAEELPSIRAMGEVIWFDVNLKEEGQTFTAGVFITEMQGQERQRWEQYQEGLAPSSE